MNEKETLVRIDNVSQAIAKADPDTLGKAIRLLDAMKRLAVGKKWVGAIGEADAWCLKARRRAGEIIEATPIPDPKITGGSRGTPEDGRPHPRKDVREELGVKRSEATSWLALAKVPEPIFEEYVEKVKAREEDGTVTGALDYARKAEKAERGEPETHIINRRSQDEIILEDLTEAIRRLAEASSEDTLNELSDEKARAMAVELMEGTVEYLQKMIGKFAIQVRRG